VALGVEAALLVSSAGSDITEFQMGERLPTHSAPLRVQGRWAEGLGQVVPLYDPQQGSRPDGLTGRQGSLGVRIVQHRGGYGHLYPIVPLARGAVERGNTRGSSGGQEFPEPDVICEPSLRVISVRKSSAPGSTALLDGPLRPTTPLRRTQCDVHATKAITTSKVALLLGCRQVRSTCTEG
jgi:hypothetical protein